MLSARFQALRLLGVAGLLGVALVVIAALTGFLLLPQARKQTSALQLEVSAAKDSAIQASEQRRNAPNTVSQLQNFLEWLPPLATNAADVQRLFLLAKEAGVDLAKADYQLTVEPGLQIVRYQATIPVREKYLTVRHFATGALNALPHLALEDLQFARTEVSTDVVDAQLRFTLFYRPQ